MAIDNVDQTSTPAVDTSAKSGPSTVSIPTSALPAGTDLGDTLQMKVIDMTGPTAKVQIVVNTSPSANKPQGFGSMGVDKMRDFLTQEATIHAADQTNV